MNEKKQTRTRWVGKTVFVVFLICLVSVLVQVFWPGKKFMVFTKVGGVDVTGLTRSEARERMVEIFTDHELKIETKDGALITSVAVPIDQIAIDAMMDEELEYPLWQRVIPFSSFVRVFYSNWIGALVNLDVDEIMAEVYAEPVDAHVSIKDDGAVVSSAKEGFSLDREDLTRRLSTLRLSNTGETVLRVSAEHLMPVVEDSVLSDQAASAEATWRGLLDTFRGSEFSVAAFSDDGTWDVEISADEPWVSASTYKLYVAYYIMGLVDAGTVSWESVGTCMERMIIDSDNSCPENWLVKYGFANVNAAVQEIGGLSNTRIASNDMQTTARDLSVFLGKLYRGELLSEGSTKQLIEIMTRQKYRQGIVAGAAPNVVADKVGFMWAMLHDAAIVYSESGDYVLVIMTNGSTWGNIAELTGIVDDFNG